MRLACRKAPVMAMTLVLALALASGAVAAEMPTLTWATENTPDGALCRW